MPHASTHARLSANWKPGCVKSKAKYSGSEAANAASATSSASPRCAATFSRGTSSSSSAPIVGSHSTIESNGNPSWFTIEPHELKTRFQKRSLNVTPCVRAVLEGLPLQLSFITQADFPDYIFQSVSSVLSVDGHHRL